MAVNSKVDYTKLFFFAFSLILAFSFIGIESALGPALKALTMISFPIFMYLFFISFPKFSRLEFLGILALLLLFLFISLITKEYSLFKLILFTLAFKNVDYKHCIKYDVWLRFYLIIAIYLLYSIGILQDVTGARGETTVRHSFGFTNPNALALAVSIFCMEFMYVYNEKRLKLKCLFIFLVMYFVTSATDSRTSLYSVVFFMILFLSNKFFPALIQNRFFLRSAQLAPIILSVMIIYMVQSYIDNPTSNMSIMYDELLSGRLDIAAVYSKLFEPALFGNNISANAFTDRSIDNFYITLFLSSGIIVSTWFFISYWILLQRLYKAGEMDLIFIFLSFTIIGISEKLWFFVDYNILMMAFGALLLKDKSSFQTKTLSK